MFVTNMSFACRATQAGCFAHLSDIPHSHVRISGRLFRNADLAVLNTLAGSHPGAAGWPLIGLGLLLDPPVGMSHFKRGEKSPTNTGHGDLPWKQLMHSYI